MDCVFIKLDKDRVRRYILNRYAKQRMKRGKSVERNIEVWPGPMEGVASAEFVRAVNSLNLVRRWMTPFLRLSAGVPGRRKVRNFLAPFLEGGVPVTAQLMGTDAQLISSSAETCLELGAAGINLNFGCPSRRVVNGGAGGGAHLLPGKRAARLVHGRGVRRAARGVLQPVQNIPRTHFC